MYGFVDVADYQKVVVTDSSKGIEVAAQNYLSSVDNEISDELLEKKTIITIVVVLIFGLFTTASYVSGGAKRVKNVKII